MICILAKEKLNAERILTEQDSAKRNAMENEIKLLNLDRSEAEAG